MLIFFLYLALNTAWLSDDSFISFRQIMNFVHGDGYTWHPGYRVQAFTHPSWVLLLTLIASVSGELYYTTLALSICLSIAALALLLAFANRLCSNSTQRLCCLLIIASLGFSRAFVDYMTSGLENPLSFFLVGLLIYLVSKREHPDQQGQGLIPVFTIMALLFLNRFDYAVLLAPLSIYLAVFKYPVRISSKAVLPGLGLILFWFLFAAFYFGSFLPNTYYAKLGAGYPLGEILERGQYYFIDSWRRDPLTLTLICAALTASLFLRNGTYRSLALGSALYCVYIFYSGGDFMRGRFLSVPAYIAAFILCAFLAEAKRSNIRNITAGFWAMMILSAIIRSPTPALQAGPYENREIKRGIADERGFYYRRYGLLSPQREWPGVVMQGGALPSSYRELCGEIGSNGLKTNDTYLIDQCGLTDSFIARLPARDDPGWRIGHHHRSIPVGYGEYLIGAVDTIEDPELQKILSDIKTLTTGPLLSQDRFTAFIRLNTSNP